MSLLFLSIKLCKRDLQNLRSPKYTNLSLKNEKYSVYIMRASMAKTNNKLDTTENSKYKGIIIGSMQSKHTE